MRTLQSAGIDADRAVTARNFFYPRATIKCETVANFRSQAARDVACLLDVDSSVLTWSCSTASLYVTGVQHVCDFVVLDVWGIETLLDAPDRVAIPPLDQIETSASHAGFAYTRRTRADVYRGFRLRNAKDLLRYGDYEVGLGDRVRLLAALDEIGSLTVAECLGAFAETKPIAGLASMILNGFVEVDLDDALIGPDTKVRRITA